MDQKAGQAPHKVGRAEQRGRKLEHGDALRRQIVVVGRIGRPEVERQRVLDRSPIIDPVAVGNGEPSPTHPLMTLPHECPGLTEKD